MIELSLLKAQAEHAVGNADRAWVALERALTLAQPEGYLRSFDRGAALTHLLVEAADHGIASATAHAYLGRILAIIVKPQGLASRQEGGAAPSSAASRSSQASTLELAEHLSERELEVLRLMARGASNQEIARQLVITVGTVKSHINHILGKLEAHNRTEAVARARDLGLLEI